MRSSLLLSGLLGFTVFSAAANVSRGRFNDRKVLTPEVDAFINQILADWNTAGGAGVAVVRLDDQGEWVVETKGYGVAKADGTPVNPDTIFPIGSNSKLFNIIATGLLISNESLSPQISWTTKIASIIPHWKLMDPVASSESTITDLMSHRTGLPAHNYGLFLSNDSFPSVLQRLKYWKPSTGFREDTQYNNAMYTVLSYLPTALLPHKPSFARYVKEHIFNRLQMNSTTFSFAAANATGRLVDGFVRQGINITENPLGKGTTRVAPYLFPATEEGDTVSGVGGILTSVVDAARWLQVLLLNGQHPTLNTTVIPAAVIQKVATGVSIWNGNGDAGQLPGFPELSPAVYGGGQVQTSYRRHVMIEHEGDLPGFHSRITRFPADGLGIAIFTNDDNFGPFFKEVLKFRIADEAFGLDPIDWNSRYKAIAQELQLAAAELTSIPTPPNASLPFKISTLKGKYRNPGYGADIELCTISSSVDQQSRHCVELVAHLKSTFPAQLATADLVWSWNTLLASYATLTHYDGPVFNLAAWVPVPTGNASAPFWPYDSRLEGNIAEFVVKSGKVTGFGLRSGLWGAGDLAGEPQGHTVEEMSEVWYEALRA